MNRNTPIIAVTVCGLLACGMTQADDSHQTHGAAVESQTLDAHIHGQAELLIAQDGAQIVLEFRSPSVNVLGFEHAAKTAEEKTSLQLAEAILSRGESLFTFVGGQCVLSGQEANMGHTEADSTIPGSNHTQENDHDADHSDSHSDIRAQYQFRCENVEQIRGMTVLLQREFSGVEKLQTEWIFEDHQGSIELRNNRPRINF